MRTSILAAIALALLTACSGGGGLHNLRSASAGPDDFSVLPVRPLEIPANLTVLPAPNTGGANLTDPNPVGDAIAALGGRPSAANAGGIPAVDAALIARVNRYGGSADIRNILAAEDTAFRKRRARGGLFGLLGQDRYFQAYAAQILDAYAELLRFRALGVRVPSAPPVN